MFERKTVSTIAPAPTLPLVIPKPVPAAPPTTVGEVELKGYIKLAESLDFAPAKLMEYRLLEFFQANGIPVYPYEKVAAYLDRILGPARTPDERCDSTKWGWRSLRAKDHEGIELQNAGCGKPNGVLFQRPYQQIVPVPVLMTVSKIEQAFPQPVPNIGFFVSDRYEPADKGDPFLMVTGPGMKRMVIERWDEPGFQR